MSALLTALPHHHSGKVRDTYRVPENGLKLPFPLLAVMATDRFSSHNVVHLSEVPNKGELLTSLMIFWLKETPVFEGIQTHLVASGDRIWKYLPHGMYDPALERRLIIVRKHEPDPREFIHRNYLTGSLERALREGDDPYGLNLSRMLPKMHRFSRPIFTPTMKSKDDEPVQTADVIRDYEEASETTAIVFERMTNFLYRRNIALIDAKYEAAKHVIIDEWGTGDCCRMAFRPDIEQGEDPPWLDKEYLRKKAEAQWAGGTKVPLTFSDDEIRQGAGRYHQAFEAITGKTLADFQREDLEYAA